MKVVCALKEVQYRQSHTKINTELLQNSHKSHIEFILVDFYLHMGTTIGFSLVSRQSPLSCKAFKTAFRASKRFIFCEQNSRFSYPLLNFKTVSYINFNMQVIAKKKLLWSNIKTTNQSQQILISIYSNQTAINYKIRPTPVLVICMKFFL